jgi:hypothetical protein
MYYVQYNELNLTLVPTAPRYRLEQEIFFESCRNQTVSCWISVEFLVSNRHLTDTQANTMEKKNKTTQTSPSLFSLAFFCS